MNSHVSDSDIEQLEKSIQGQVIRPRHPDYASARQVFNAMIDRRPALILRCASTADVAAGVKFGRQHGLPIAVRGGGHSVAGYSVCEGGILLDMSAMKGVKIDPVQRVAVAQPGLTLGELDRATHEYGLATPLGVVSVTGIAGLTLGGGIGWLNGKYGLSCDNLLAAEVVTAEGNVVEASAQQHPDLLWALKGGSGNFGVVTSFTYRLHPVSEVFAGNLVFSANKAATAMRVYHEFAADAPDELSTMGALWRDEHGQPVFAVTACYCGDHDAGKSVLAPLRQFGPPVADTIAATDYLALQTGSDAAFPHGRQHYWKASFLEDLSPEAISTILKFVAEMPSPFCVVGLQRMSGFASRVAPDATAFAHRAQHYDFLILSQWQDASETAANIEWARAFFDAMSPFLERGVYTNNLGDEGESRVRDAFGSNYQRLSEVKAKYDPENIFHLNANIRPAS